MFVGYLAQGGSKWKNADRHKYIEKRTGAKKMIMMDGKTGKS